MTLYKSYVNVFLAQLRRGDLGLSIGNIYMGTPTVADDLLMLSMVPDEALSTETDETQCMLDLLDTFASKRRYGLNNDKSVILEVLPNKKHKPAERTWMLRGKEISTSDTLTHVGVKRFACGIADTTIEEHILCANRCAYALMGAGLHGSNGAGPKVCYQIVKTYVLPRLVYGLEVLLLTKKQMNELSTYYLQLLKHIQGLPKRTASCAVYLLIGAIPAEGIVHLRQLTLIGAIARSENKSLCELAIRQLAIHSTRTSWFPRTQELLDMYDLPDMMELLDHPIAKV